MMPEILCPYYNMVYMHNSNASRSASKAFDCLQSLLAQQQLLKAATASISVTD